MLERPQDALPEFEFVRFDRERYAALFQNGVTATSRRHVFADRAPVG
jgi:hypothetical protein